MNAPSRNKVVFALALVASVAALAFWMQEARLHAIRTDQRLLLDARRFPFLLTGLRLELPPLVTVVDGTHGSQFADAPRRRLLVALSDRCPFCVEAQPALCQVLTDQRLDHTDEVVLLSFAGTQLMTDLLSCARQNPGRARVVAGLIKSTQQFSVLTGILATPSFVTVDSSWRVTASYSSRQSAEWQAHVFGADHLPQTTLSEGR